MFRGCKNLVKNFLIRNIRFILILASFMIFFNILFLSTKNIENEETIQFDIIKEVDGNEKIDNCHLVNDLKNYLKSKLNDEQSENHEECNKKDWILINDLGVCRYNNEYLNKQKLVIQSCFYSVVLPNSQNFDSSYTISSEKYELNDGTELNKNFEFFYISCKANKENSISLFSHKYKTAYARILKPKQLGLNQQEPINVLFLGLDSISKIGWLDKLPKSSQFLIETLQTNILNGYNIIGDG